MLEETVLLDLILNILPVDTADPMLYYFKLEALWILINLCYGPVKEIDRILNFTEINGDPETRHSHLLDLIDGILKDIQLGGFNDLKVFSLVLHVCSNIANTS